MENRDPRYEPSGGGCGILVAPLVVVCAVVFGVIEVVLLTKDYKDIHHPVFTVIATFLVTVASAFGWAQANSKTNDAALGKTIGVIGIALVVALLVYAGSMVLGSAIVTPACSSH